MTGAVSSPGVAVGTPPSEVTPASDATRARKFRQAAFVYLHVAVLYEAAVFAMWDAGMLGRTRLGPPWLWLLLGAVIAAAIFVGLYRWQNVWLARIVWAVHALRLPRLIAGAFFATGDARIAPSFYLVAIIVVTINLWMLARAGWDL